MKVVELMPYYARFLLVLGQKSWHSFGRTTPYWQKYNLKSIEDNKNQDCGTMHWLLCEYINIKNVKMGRSTCLQVSSFQFYAFHRYISTQHSFLTFFLHLLYIINNNSKNTNWNSKSVQHCISKNPWRDGSLYQRLLESR